MKLNRLTPRDFVLNLYNVITQHEKLEERQACTYQYGIMCIQKELSLL